jgi:hypothetical protein
MKGSCPFTRIKAKRRKIAIMKAFALKYFTLGNIGEGQRYN